MGKFCYSSYRQLDVLSLRILQNQCVLFPAVWLPVDPNMAPEFPRDPHAVVPMLTNAAYAYTLHSLCSTAPGLVGICRCQGQKRWRKVAVGLHALRRVTTPPVPLLSGRPVFWPLSRVPS